MAKTAQSLTGDRQSTVKPLVLYLRDKEDADLALKEIGRLKDRIAQVEGREREDIRQAEERMIEETKLERKWLAALEKELERWARENEETWEGRTLALNFGKLFFRASSGAIRLVRSIEYVLDHLKAKKLRHCIRVVEEPDKEAIKALDDATVKEIGCKREKPHYFHYEVFRTEVK